MIVAVSAWESEVLGRFTGITYLVILRSQLADASLANILPMTGLSRLTLHETEVSDHNDRHLVKVPSLTSLELRGSSFTDQSLEDLRGHAGPSGLRLRGTSITGGGIPAIVGPQLGFLELDFSKSAISDETTEHLMALRPIAAVVLDLSDTAITDTSLVCIGKITTLAGRTLSTPTFPAQGQST